MTGRGDGGRSPEAGAARSLRRQIKGAAASEVSSSVMGFAWASPVSYFLFPYCPPELENVSIKCVSD